MVELTHTQPDTMKRFSTFAVAAMSAVLATPSPSPAAEADDSKTAIATIGGGCFWCTEAQYKMKDGVTKVVSGYAGGHKENPTYKEVCAETTGHAEVIQIHYDPSKVSYKDLIDLFWWAHDPTTLNRQGNDRGTQYRSIILYNTDEEKAIAEASMKEAQENWADPIVTEIVPLKKFYPAEDYHQDYFAQNPEQGYCRVVVKKKVEHFKEALEKKGEKPKE